MTIGALPNVDVGTEFNRRADVAAAGVHRHLIAGIVGTEQTGAESIVLSGGYEDDEDYGDVIIYTGQGGRDPNTGRQIADQSFTRGNQALVTSCLHGMPVRVVRGSTARGYHYAGLFRVDDYWMETGRAGFQICRFRLTSIDAPASESTAKDSGAKRVPTTILRIVRDTNVSRQMKELNDYTCQVCSVRLECVGGAYAEGAHIQPLGAPHHGPDIAGNLLCLCPNHHVLFDHGGFTIDDAYNILGLPEHAKLAGKTRPDAQFLSYHRALWKKSSGLP